MNSDCFVCPRHAGALLIAPAACARMYARGKKAAPWDAAHLCRGCEIGARHAGEPCAGSPTRGDMTCVRCGRASFRLIGACLCPSCYNRQRELVTGRYRRLAPPGGFSVAPVSVTAQNGDSVCLFAASLGEARAALRRWSNGAPLVSAYANASPWRAPVAWPQLTFPGF